MKKMVLHLASRDRRRSERGATATEYGLLVLFIAMAIVLGVTAFGEAVDDWYGRLAAEVADFL